MSDHSSISTYDHPLSAELTYRFILKYFYQPNRQTATEGLLKTSVVDQAFESCVRFNTMCASMLVHYQSRHQNNDLIFSISKYMYSNYNIRSFNDHFRILNSKVIFRLSSLSWEWSFIIQLNKYFCLLSTISRHIVMNT